MWNQARNAVSMMGSTVLALEVILQVAKQTAHAREALTLIAAVGTTLVEGFQGRVDPHSVNSALLMLRTDLMSRDWIPSPDLVEKLKNAL